MFALLIPALVGALAAAMASFVGRAILALGIGFVTYKGIDLSIAALKTTAIDSIKGLPADILGFLGFMWVDKAMTVIFSAVVTAMAIRALGGSIKKDGGQMITLFSGLPGNGKTLFALWYLVKKAKAENREVFYNGVKGLDGQKVGNWQEFDPAKWFELPHGAMILMDECQDTFGKKPNGATLPPVYSELNTHRHRGYDIFLITQHPTLLDNSVRRLIGQHFHTVRKFGLERATIYEWSACNPSPENASSQKSAVSLKWAFPKEVYGWYKSAEVHTVKKAIPAKLILAVLFVIAVPCVGYYALTKYQSRGKPDAVPAAAIANGVPVSSVAPAAPSGHVAVVDPVVDAKQYLFNQTPRVTGLPHTAPRYDQITQPVRAPVPAACIQIGSVKSSTNIRCQCYSQQGTKMDVEFNMCVQIAQNGWFRDFEPDSQAKQDSQRQASQGGQERPSVAVDESRPMVVAFNEASPSVAASVPPAAPAGDPRPGRAIRSALPKQ